MSHSCLSVARYLLDRADTSNRPFSPMKLIKLVYIAHGWTLGLYGRPLIREAVEAWRYGPVIRELYQEVKQFRTRPVPAEHVAPPEDDEKFDAGEQSVMDQVHDIYGRHSAIQLSRMTHSPGTPWDIVYNELGQDFVIPNDLIEDHYKLLPDCVRSSSSNRRAVRLGFSPGAPWSVSARRSFRALRRAGEVGRLSDPRPG